MNKISCIQKDFILFIENKIHFFFLRFLRGTSEFSATPLYAAGCTKYFNVRSYLISIIFSIIIIIISTFYFTGTMSVESSVTSFSIFYLTLLFNFLCLRYFRYPTVIWWCYTLHCGFSTYVFRKKNYRQTFFSKLIMIDYTTKGFLMSNCCKHLERN